MKKRMSVSALGVRLTLWPVVYILVLCTGLQWAAYFRTVIQWANEGYQVFQWLLDHQWVDFWGKMSFPLILAVTLLAPRHQSRYTLSRLRLCQWELTARWALVFSGWFFLSWAVQLLTVMGMFRLFAPVMELEPMDFFLACYSSRYLRCLLPMGSGWAFARNILMCLSWGMTGALTGLYTRCGGKPFMALVVAIGTLVLLPSGVASLTGDVWMCIVMLALVAAQIAMAREVTRNAD